MVFGAIKLDACCADSDSAQCGRGTTSIAAGANLRDTGTPPIPVACFT
ncbi:MAG: hypothetical protein HRU17_10735 [Polyangiaceae bacterium]|nr:hypothetical protein [Polyangiaceae bacterium]